jgi:hypothetical protein
MVGNYAAKQIGRYAAHEAYWCAEARHADRDIETRSADNGHNGVAPVLGFNRQEIDQGVSATQ